MRDHFYNGPEGRVPVSQMKLSDIEDVLRDGTVAILDGALPGETSENVMERLRIELLIRQLGL